MTVFTLTEIDRTLCTDEYCFVCGRATEHGGEHSDEQLLAAAERWSYLLGR